MQSQSSSSPDPYGTTSDGSRRYSQPMHQFTQDNSNTGYLAGPYDHNQTQFHTGDSYALPGIPHERHLYGAAHMDLDHSTPLGIRSSGMPHYSVDTNIISDRNTDATPRMFSAVYGGPVWRTPGENRIVRPQHSQGRRRAAPSVNSFTQGAQDSGYRSFQDGSVPMSQKGDDRPSVISPDELPRLSSGNMNPNFPSTMGPPVYSTQSETASTYGHPGPEQRMWYTPSSSTHQCNVESCKEHGKLMGHSEYKKHMQRHERPWRCEVEGCKRSTGFATKNDLGRHLKAVHGRLTENANVRNFLCQGRDCPHDSKVWPRLDNFKAHCKRLHKDENLEDLIRRSEIPRRSRPPPDWSARDVGEAAAPLEELETPTSPVLSAVSAQKSITSSRNSESRFADSGSSPNPGDSTFMNVTRVKDYAETSRSMGQSEVAQVSQVYISSEIVPSIHLSPDGPSKQVREVATSRLEEAVDLIEHTPSARSERRGNSLKAKNRFSSRDRHLLQDKLASSLERAKSGNSSITPQRVTELAIAGIESLWQQLDATIYLSAEDSGAAAVQATQETVPIPPTSERRSNKRSANVTSINDCEPTAKRARNEVTMPSKEKPKFMCKCGVVKKRQCDLKKHVLRHEKPWGCTYAMCDKSFGSKNDWKRHENGQHERAQMWRCQEPDENSLIGICAKSFSTADRFRMHLTKEHALRDEQHIKEQQRQARVGKNWQDRFWCGFCCAIIKLESKGVQAWDERYNHIDEKHIRKGDRIGEWYPLDKDVPKAELLKQGKREKQRSLSLSDDEDSEPMSSRSRSRRTPLGHVRTPTPTVLLSDEETHTSTSHAPRSIRSQSMERSSSEGASADSG